MTPTKATVAKAARLATDPDRRIVVDLCDPGTPAFMALVPSATKPGEAYAVTYGEMLGWRCGHPYATRRACSHMMACWVLLEAGPDWPVWEALIDQWLRQGATA